MDKASRAALEIAGTTRSMIGGVEGWGLVIDDRRSFLVGGDGLLAAAATLGGCTCLDDCGWMHSRRQRGLGDF
ncbi:hypothetical protein QYF36_008827 [Acer negundo]|nr:hypothetical protein QYF36_008827 [Acer negundo]